MNDMFLTAAEPYKQACVRWRGRRRTASVWRCARPTT